MHRSHPAYLALALTAALLLAGCGQHDGGAAPAGPGGVDPGAPVAAGHGPLPLPGQPTPLAERPPEGLYAAPPSADTLQRLGQAPLSPDGRYRALFTGGEAWVARVDGAWIWQVQAPEVQQPVQQPQQPQQQQQAPAGQAAAPPPVATPPPAGPATVTDSLQWTPRSTLLFQDSHGVWHEANPDTAIVTPLPSAFWGAANLTPSPDGQQVLYYRGTQLFTARWNGTQVTLVGDNLVGHWDSAGQLATTARAGNQPQQ